MIRLSVERILLLHQLMIAQTGGSDGVRDMGLLESAVESMYASFDGKDLYPGKEEKAARRFERILQIFQCDKKHEKLNYD